MADWSVGDWVFAFFEEEEYWYPAKIVRVQGGNYTVRYDYDNSEEVVKIDYLDEYSAFAGEKGAECYVDDEDEYYAVVIKKVNGEKIQVRYDDGSEEWMDLSNLRYAKK